MRFAVFLETRGGWHVDDSFDELGLLDLRVRQVAPLELRPRQTVAVGERGRTG
jgi:hypothetical protein